VPICSGGVTSTQDELADLEKLAAELAGRGRQAKPCIPAGGLAYLEAGNSRVSVLAERVYTQVDAYWFGSAEKIAGRDGVTQAADVMGRVLATPSGSSGE
jgi:hypothetical protein